MKNIHFIFAAIVLLLSVEYLTFGGGFSVFRILIFPLAVLGIFLMRGLHLRQSSVILWYGLLFYFVWVIGSNYLIGNSGDSITYLLIAVFSFFLIKYFSSFPEKLNSMYRYTYWFALPHEIVYLLILAGFLSMPDYTMGYSMRFIGFHRDPNFMTIFVSIAILSKIQYLKVSSSHVVWKLVILGSIALDIWLVIMGMSRGGILCLLACMVLQVLSFIPGKKKFLVAGLMLVVAVSFMMYARQFNEVSGSYQSSFWNMLARFNNDDFSKGSGRKEIWQKNMHDIVEFPLTPLGTNLEERPDAKYTHNTYIDILLTSGLIFGSVFVFFLVSGQVRSISDVLKNGSETGYLVLSLVVVSQLFFLSLLTLKLTWFFFILLLHNLSYKKIPVPDYAGLRLSPKFYKS
ncbi:MAG: O-antigen ligase family protein [Dysgonamonadaceae bacterium]|jgi:hypothetical protein|nr:O-antigen ligase family protein [Dysgonamonadaceae bacterium]